VAKGAPVHPQHVVDSPWGSTMLVAVNWSVRIYPRQEAFEIPFLPCHPKFGRTVGRLKPGWHQNPEGESMNSRSREFGAISQN